MITCPFTCIPMHSKDALYDKFLVALSTQERTVIDEQLIYYINQDQCYLEAETVPVDKLCCTYQKNGFCNFSRKQCLEGATAYMNESNKSV